jgi:glycerophosphoryl diester phosphodiesterase
MTPAARLRARAPRRARPAPPAGGPPRPLRPGPLVIAHRGDSRACPENTLAAFASAAAAGADGIELDVRLSADGIPVVCHDATLARFGGGARRLSRRTLADLGRDSVGAWFAPRFAAERIPTLAAALGSFPRLVCIELKAGGGRGAAANDRRLAAAVVRVVAQARAGARVQLLCFAPAVLTELARLAPQLPRVRNAERDPADPGAWLDRQAAVQAVCVDQRVLTAGLVAAARARGMRIYAYSCNTPRELARLRRHAPDARLTDRPAWLISQRASRRTSWLKRGWTSRPGR